jgi:AP-2 complex subunit beta-1
MFYVPTEATDAELLAERISIRLQQSNSAVVLATIKVILFLVNFIDRVEAVDNLLRKLGPPLGASCRATLF